MYLQTDYSLRENRKIRRFARALGVGVPQAIGHLVLFWITAQEQCPDGVLCGWDAEDIADAARWTGEARALTEALLGCVLLDDTPDGYAIHNRERYCDGLIKAARRKRDRERKREQRKSVPDPVSVGQIGTRLDTSVGQDPRVRTEKRREEKRREEQIRSSPAAPNARSASLTKKISLVWGKYREHHPKTAKSLKSTSKEYKKIRDRLESYTVVQLSEAIDQFHKIPYYLGDNEQKTKYLGILTIFREDSQIQKALEWTPPKKKSHPTPTATPLSPMHGITPEQAEKHSEEGLARIDGILKQAGLR